MRIAKIIFLMILFSSFLLLSTSAQALDLSCQPDFDAAGGNCQGGDNNFCSGNCGDNCNAYQCWHCTTDCNYSYEYQLEVYEVRDGALCNNYLYHETECYNLSGECGDAGVAQNHDCEMKSVCDSECVNVTSRSIGVTADTGTPLFCSCDDFHKGTVNEYVSAHETESCTVGGEDGICQSCVCSLVIDECSDYVNQTECTNDPANLNCTWCPNCSDHKFIDDPPGEGVCINDTEPCPNRSCIIGECGAHCTDDPGSRISGGGDTCYYGTCCGESCSLQDSCQDTVRHVNKTCNNWGCGSDTHNCMNLPHILSANCTMSGSDAICNITSCETCYNDTDGNWSNGCEENICETFKGFSIWTPPNSSFNNARDVCDYNDSIQYIADRTNYYNNNTERWEPNYTIYSCHHPLYPFNNNFNLKVGKGYIMFSEETVGFLPDPQPMTSEVNLTPGMNLIGANQSIDINNISDYLVGEYSWICGK